MRAALDADYRPGERELNCVFPSDLKTNAYRGARCPPNDRRRKISWRLRECIRVREFAVTHRLERECVVCGCSRSRRPANERLALTESR